MAESEKVRLAATSLSEEDCQQILTMLHGGRGGQGEGRFRELHKEIKSRDDHFYATKAADPKFMAPFENAQTFQSDIIRRTYARGRSRIIEHTPTFHVTPAKDTQPWRDAAHALTDYFTDGLRQAEERAGFSIAGHLFHGQALHCFGVLHWHKFDDYQPEMPDPETIEEGTASAVLDEYRQKKADAPFPWWFDVPRSDSVGFVEDRSLHNGMGIYTTIESIGYLAYKQQLEGRDQFYLSLNQKDSKIDVFTEKTRPEDWDESGSSQYWGDLRIGRVWLRGECYELASHGAGSWTLVKSWTHRHGMPPFVHAKAMETNHPDPLYRWQPWMLGLFRTKPQYDYERSLGRLFAEQTAIPRYWIELAPGTFMVDGRGNRRVFAENANVAEIMPEGSKLVRAEMELSPAFIQFLQASKGDINEAEPETGFVDVGTSTQPHTVLMAQTQANTEIAELKGEEARALRIAFQNIVHDMAEEADSEDMSAFIKDKAGKVYEIPADMLRGMTVEVDIEPNSGAQQVAKNEYLRGLLNDPKAMYTVRNFLGDTGEKNPDAQIASWAAEQAEFSVMPQMLQQEMVRAYGDAYVLTPGGTAVGMDGKPASPWDVLINHGFMQPQQPEAQGPRGMNQGRAPLALTLPQMQPMQPPPTGVQLP